ncbi:hypothetical protein NITMOv2_4307 [Nitrospira moscoviensis]|uniref:Uncharacterized protein n=1 Tax=Nitrospira moscoviensis TaxID=42253 RepID=A0A0K2GI88_NITMO|nr:hypothetical protein NITMOv2_4307 [Nitrospira moscoviensis]
MADGSTRPFPFAMMDLPILPPAPAWFITHDVHDRLTTRFTKAVAVGFAAVVLGSFGCSGAPVVAETPRCPDSVHATVSRAKPTVTLSYTEPTVNAAGTPLQGLTKTTIYYDAGTGRVPAKEVPATGPSGGGRVSETITVPLADGQETVVRICVTATDRQGNESAMTP